MISELGDVPLASLFTLFYSLILLCAGSYNWLIAALLLHALCNWHKASWDNWTQSDRRFALALAVYPLTLLLSLSLQGGYLSAIDYPARVLPMLGMLLVWCRWPACPRLHLGWQWGVLSGGVLAGLAAVWHVWIAGAFRAGNFITNEIPYAQIAALLALMALVLLLSAASWRWRLAALSAFAMATLAVLLSGTRGALLGLLLTGALVGVLCVHWSLRRAVLALLACGVMFGVASQIPVLQARAPETLSDVQRIVQGDRSGSIGIRLQLWEHALDLARQSPLLGAGPGNYKLTLRERAANDLPGYLKEFSHAHSQYFDTLGNAGVLGLLALLISQIIPLYCFMQRWRMANGVAREAALAGIAVIVASAIFGVTQPVYAHNISTLFYLLSLMVCWALAREPVEPTQASMVTRQTHVIVHA